MPTFEEQVEVLSGITVESSGSSPTQSDLSQFLRDGVLEVMNRCISLKPEEVISFTRESSEQSSNNSLDLNGANIISIVREGGLSKKWRPCSPILPGDQSLVEDVDSLKYASAYNPVYMIGTDGKLSVFPAPTGSEGFKVYYTNNVPVDKSGASLLYSHSDIGFFPETKKYLVVLYASCQALLANLAKFETKLPADLSIPVLEDPVSSLPVFTVPGSLPTFTVPDSIVSPISPPDFDVDLSDLSALTTFSNPVLTVTPPPTISSLSISETPPSAPIVSGINFTQEVPIFIAPTITLETISITDLTITATPPVTPDIVLSTVGALPTAPSYIPAFLSLESKPVVSDLSLSDIVIPIAPSIGEHVLDTSGLSDPTFTPPIMNTPDWADVNTWISAEEDVEMSDARVREIQGKVQEFAARLQESQADFNKESSILQKDLKVAMTNLEGEHHEEETKIKKYSTEIAEYQATINKRIQEHNSNYEKEYQLWQEKNNADLNKYRTDAQQQFNLFNTENHAYQAGVQKLLQQAQLDESKEARIISRFQSDIEIYRAEVNNEIQEWVNNTNKDTSLWQQRERSKIEKYQIDLQASQAQYNKEALIYQTEFNRSAKNADIETQSEIQLYQSDISRYQAVVNKDVQEFKSNLEKNISIWQQEYQGQLQTYKMDLDKENARVGSAIQNYKTLLDKNLQKYSAETSYDVSKYTGDIQNSVQKFQNDLSKNKTDFDSKLNAYTTELNRNKTDFDSKLAAYTSELTKVNTKNEVKIANFNSQIQDYTAKINKVNLQFQQVQNSYVSLKQKYDEAFQIMYPRKGEDSAK